MLRIAGVEQFKAQSGLGHPFVCHLGDFFGEFPFYNREAFQLELTLCASWLASEEKPIIVDVGANVGFWSTQLVQMLDHETAHIYAFEPVPSTFCKLTRSIDALSLQRRITPIPAALSSAAQIVSLSVNPKSSGFAQVSRAALNARAGDRLSLAIGYSLDDFIDSIGIAPSLVKIDVEGSEIEVLRGAMRLLTLPSRPALLFEFNPITLAETQTPVSLFDSALSAYSLYYVDDFEGQRLPYGASVESLRNIHWVCNIFAIPAESRARERFDEAIKDARARLSAKNGDS